MKPAILLSILLYPLMFADASSQEVSALTGRWRTIRHGALVDIVDCGDATPCANLSWIDEAISEGNTQDIRNRNSELRNRPLIGAPILWGFEAEGTGWRDGWLYNPEDGKTFRAHMRLLSDRELEVSGCIGVLCRSQIWTRAD